MHVLTVDHDDTGSCGKILRFRKFGPFTLASKENTIIVTSDDYTVVEVTDDHFLVRNVQRCCGQFDLLVTWEEVTASLRGRRGRNHNLFDVGKGVLNPEF